MEVEFHSSRETHPLRQIPNLDYQRHVPAFNRMSLNNKICTVLSNLLLISYSGSNVIHICSFMGQTKKVHFFTVVLGSRARGDGG